MKMKAIHCYSCESDSTFPADVSPLECPKCGEPYVYYELQIARFFDTDDLGKENPFVCNKDP
jgi:hypothetical protein